MATLTAPTSETLDHGSPGPDAQVESRSAAKPRYRYRLLVGRHIEADPDAVPDRRTGIVPDRVFQGPTTFLSVVPDLHVRFPNKFATPEGTNLVAGVPEGSLVFDPSCETLDDFVRRAQESVAPGGNRRTTAGGLTAAGVDAPTTAPVTTVGSAALPAYAQSGKNAPPDFDKMGLKQMKDYAAAEEIDVSGADTVTALRDLLRKAKTR